jgi:hypothetical protein
LGLIVPPKTSSSDSVLIRMESFSPHLMSSGLLAPHRD